MSANTLLLLHGEDLIDSSAHGRAITNNGVSVSSAQSKFGGKSLYFDGSSYLTVDVPVSGDMTFECWMYTTEYATSYPTPFNHLNGSSRGYYAHVMSGLFAPAAYKASGDSSGQDLSLEEIPANSWHHVAMVRSGTIMSVYLDGVLKGNISNVHTTNDTLYLGELKELPSYTYFKGYLDEIRVSDCARWTSDFEPPSKAYDNPPPDGHNTLIDGVAREIESGILLLGGVAREIENGTALVGGVARKIGFGDNVCTVNITGAGSSAYAYVSLGDYNYYSAETVEVSPGTAIVFVATSRGSYYAQIILNGEIVKSGVLNTTISYEMTVDQDMNVALFYDTSYRYGTITITTG